MATWLSEYKNLKNEMEKQIGAGHASLEQLMLYQELLYRIEVLYASQAFCQTAPVTTDVAVLSGHYQLVDAYIQCLTKERRLGQLSARRRPRPLTRSFWIAGSGFPASPQQIRTSIARV